MAGRLQVFSSLSQLSGCSFSLLSFLVHQGITCFHFLSPTLNCVPLARPNVEICCFFILNEQSWAHTVFSRYRVGSQRLEPWLLWIRIRNHPYRCCLKRLGIVIDHTNGKIQVLSPLVILFLQYRINNNTV